MQTAVSHLLEMGYKNLAFVAYKSSLQHMKDREQGFLDASATIQSKVYKINFNKQQQELNKVLDEILETQKADAIVFATNTLSVAGLKYLTQKGVQIPKDLNVMCFDFSEVYDFFYHPIIHVKQPIEQLAKDSVVALTQQMKDHTIQKKVLRSELIAKTRA